MVRVKAVVRRLITVDRVLMVIEEAADGNPDNRVIDVNPNHATD